MIDDVINRILSEAPKRTSVKVWDETKSTADAISRWEKASGYLLPEDYRQFLKLIGRCKLHGASPEMDHSFAVKLYSLIELKPFSERAFGRRSFDGIPPSWFAIADAQDGNFVVMDLATVLDKNVNIIDGFSESAPNLAIISRSFEEFLQCSLEDPHTSSGGGDVRTGARYWSKPGHYYGQTI